MYSLTPNALSGLTDFMLRMVGLLYKGFGVTVRRRELKVMRDENWAGRERSKQYALSGPSYGVGVGFKQVNRR